MHMTVPVALSAASPASWVGRQVLLMALMRHTSLRLLCCGVLWCAGMPYPLQFRRSFDALDQDHDSFITSADLLNRTSLVVHLSLQHPVSFPVRLPVLVDMQCRHLCSPPCCAVLPHFVACSFVAALMPWIRITMVSSPAQIW